MPRKPTIKYNVIIHRDVFNKYWDIELDEKTKWTGLISKEAAIEFCNKKKYTIKEIEE